ncbi:MAG: hypothetical protein Aurels2KO_04580 [Aureliella sp.]
MLDAPTIVAFCSAKVAPDSLRNFRSAKGDCGSAKGDKGALAIYLWKSRLRPATDTG